MRSERLRYRPVQPDDLDAFHRLVDDEYIGRYLLDGVRPPRQWSAERIRQSRDLFARRGVGVWLAHAAETGELVGFCGFWTSPDSPEPMLVYALLEPWSGRGLAAEMGRTVIAHARAAGSFTEITADADAINARSVRVLDQLGFERIGVRPGAFGDILLFRLSVGPNSARPG
jgi:RimJ/RimL family protein N-acetyltransferase